MPILRFSALRYLYLALFFSVFLLGFHHKVEAATYTVTTTADSGAGSLRQAITDANGNSGADTVLCDASLSGTITVLTALPEVTDAVTLDCSDASSMVTLATASPALVGFKITATGNHLVQGWIIDGFSIGVQVLHAGAEVTLGGTLEEESLTVSSSAGPGLSVGASTSVLVQNSRFDGNATGISVNSSATNVVVGGVLEAQRNVIVNNITGVKIEGSVSNVAVINNYIGLELDGSTAGGNTQTGVRILGTGTNIVIGGATSAYSNVIANSGLAGIELAAQGVTVRNNVIGLNAAGTATASNQDGLLVTGSNHVIQENIISGNANAGIMLRDDSSAVEQVQILDNIIGLNPAETTKRANGRGVVLDARNGFGVIDTLIQDNRIAGSTTHGIEIREDISTGTQIWGNIIGSGSSFATGLGNGAYGISVEGDSVDMDASVNNAKRNIIIHNAQSILFSGNSGLVMKNNYVGWNGTDAASNTGTMILINSGATNNEIGGVGANEGNTFCADSSTNEYVVIAGTAGDGNAIRGNSISCDIGLLGDPMISVTAAANNSYATAPTISIFNTTAVAGDGACASCSVDVYGYTSTPSLEYVTTLTANSSGVFSENLDLSAYTAGVVAYTDSFGNTSTATVMVAFGDVASNFVITNTNDSGVGSLRFAITNALYSIDEGVELTCHQDLTGTISLSSSLPSLTKGFTLDCSGSASQVTFSGSGFKLFDIDSGSNYTFKGFKTSGTTQVFDIASEVTDITLGGVDTAEGLYLYDPTGVAISSAADNLTIQNTEIELATVGVSIASGSSNVALGTANAAGTLSVHDNSSNGIAIAGASGLTIYNTTLDDNGSSGIEISSSSGDVTIGGTASNQRNVIIGSTGAGIVSTSVSGLDIVNNYIGIQSDGATANGNGSSGITISGTCTSCVVGGVTSAEGNVIGSNTTTGINVTAAGVTIQNNKIGTNAAGTAARANGSHGIAVSAASVTLEDNLVSGNTGVGISVSDLSAVTGLIIRSNTVGLKADQTTALGNGNNGIALSSNLGAGITGALIQENIVSANSGAGIQISGTGTTGTQIWGNKVGTDVTGLLSRGNSSAGLNLGGTGSSDLDASLDSTKRNIIAGNSGECISINSPNNIIRNQYCGFGADGTTEITNGSSILSLNAGATDNIIGGIEPDQGNLMCASTGFNVYVLLNSAAGNGNSIRGNTIGCDDYRIPLAGYGNLVAEMIARPLGGTSNNNYTAPTFSHATPLSVSGTSACANCAVDIYGQDAARGAVYVGSGTANGSGAWAFEVDISAYDYAIATFTGTQGSTSTATAPLALEVEDDADGDGISNITEVRVGTSDSDSTDNDTIAEQTRTLFLASNTTADGVPSAAEMRNTAAIDGEGSELLSNVTFLFANQYEEGIADPTSLGLPDYVTPGYPTRAELQAVIDAVNGGNTPEFTVSESDGTTELLEGGTDIFTVVLSGMAPVEDVVFELSSSDAGAASVSPSTLTFTSENWNTPQTITVAGTGDSDLLDETVDITVSINAAASDDSFDALADQIVNASVTDQLGQVVIVESDDETSLTETGTDTFTIVLAGVTPQSDVVFDLSSSDAGAATISPSTVTFTPDDWETPQTITVAGVSDSDTNNESVSFTFAVDAASSFDSYDAVAEQVVVVPVTDQLGAFTVTQSGGTTALLEGGTDTFTVALASLQPASNVVLNVTSGDTGAASVSPSTLTFTSENWNTPQTVTVTGVSDVDTNDESVTLTLAVDDASSFDSYDAVEDQTVAAAITDTTEEDTPSSGNGNGGGGGVRSSEPAPQEPTTPQEPEPIEEVLVIDVPVIKESLAQEKDSTVIGDEFTIEEGRKYGYPVGAFDPVSDADMDGLPYFDEIVMLSSNEDSDSDGDGVADGLEVLTGTDPLNANEFKIDALDITLDCPDGTSFPDTEENFARIAVCMLAHQGIIQGREADAFVPDAEVTRAELTKMILLTPGITPKSLPAYSFKDLDFDAWYYPYVTTAHKIGLVTGYQDGSFKPNQSVTRAEAISILIRAFRGEDQSILENPYQDVFSNDWFAHNVLLGSHDGLIVGRTPGFFAPLGTLTRAEAAILIRRAQYAYAQ